MEPTRKLSRHSLPDQVAATLREMIVLGDLPWGEKISVSGLSQDLSVSQTPLREALKVLAAEGLVELLPNRGARVATYTPEDARVLFEVIAKLESMAAELACRRMSAEELDELENLHERMRGYFDALDKEPYFDLNTAIHERIVELARNDVLRSIHAKLMVRARRGRFIAITDRDRWIEAMEEHECLMHALRNRDAAAAEAIWREHLEHTGEATIKALAAAAREPEDLQHA